MLSGKLIYTFTVVITYDVYTPYIGSAREIAVRRARAEGWTRFSVLNVQKVGLDAYEVTLVISK